MAWACLSALIGSVNTLGLDSILELDPGLPELPGVRDDQEIGVCFTRPNFSLIFNPEPWRPWLPSSTSFEHDYVCRAPRSKMPTVVRREPRPPGQPAEVRMLITDLFTRTVQPGDPPDCV